MRVKKSCSVNRATILWVRNVILSVTSEQIEHLESYYVFLLSQKWFINILRSVRGLSFLFTVKCMTTSLAPYYIFNKSKAIRKIAKYLLRTDKIVFINQLYCISFVNLLPLNLQVFLSLCFCEIRNTRSGFMILL